MNRYLAGLARRLAENLIFWLIAAAVLGVLIFGTWGWWDRLYELPPGQRAADSIFRALRAFTFGDIYDDPGQWRWDWRLRLTRWLGLFATATAILRIMFAFAAYQVKKFQAWFWRDHAVAIGDHVAARRFAELWLSGAAGGWKGKSKRVIHQASRVEDDIDGVLTIQRARTLDDRLSRDSLRGVNRILVAENSDTLTADTALNLARAYPSTSIFAMVGQSWLAARLNHVGDRDVGVVKDQLTVFSESVGAASAVLRQYPPFLLARRLGLERLHIIIIGYGDAGEALTATFLNAARVDGFGTPMITIIDLDADLARRRFNGRYPMLTDEALVDVCFIGVDAEYLTGDGLDTLIARCRKAEPCAAYVTMSEFGAPLSAAISLRETADRHELFTAPIFVRSRERTVIAAASHPLDFVAKRQFIRFGSWRDVLAASGLLDEHPDEKAKSLHDEYLSFKTHEVTDKPWPELQERFRVSNRRAVAHIPAKLFSAGFNLEAWGESIPLSPNALPDLRTGEPFYRNATEWMQLARLEHRRWMIDRTLDGWRLGERNDDSKHHDMLIPFDDLPLSEVRKDLAYIRLLASWLRHGDHGLPRRRDAREAPEERAEDREMIEAAFAQPDEDAGHD